MIPTPQTKNSFAPSPEKDDDLTIKKLKVQHSIQTPIQPSQPIQIATSTPEIMNLEDSDEEQDLQGLKTSIFNKFPSLFPQTTTIPTPSEQPELILKQLEQEPRLQQLKQPSAEQTMKHVIEQTVEHAVRSEQQNIEQNIEQTIKYTIIKQDTPNIPEQANPSPTEQTMPPTEDLQSMPPVSQDEGYGHGISIDSMIVTPLVPILGE